MDETTRKSGSWCYDHPRPMASVDIALFSLEGGVLKTLLIVRGKEPFRGKWAFPGGFVEMDEDIPVAAARELKEETGVEGIPLDFLGVYGKPGRDPRGRVISSVFTAAVPPGAAPPAAGDDAANAQWISAAEHPPLAFDHEDVLAAALSNLRTKARREGMIFRLLGPEFTPASLREAFEAVLGASPLEEEILRKAGGILAPSAEGFRVDEAELRRRIRATELFDFR